jgi:hypothetical protein
MLTRVVQKLAGIAVLAAVAFASPASAVIYNTATQTVSYGPQAPAWTHTFTFAPYVYQGPATTFNSVHLNITGTQTTAGGSVTCFLGVGGAGDGTSYCTGTYNQQAKFSLVSGPVPVVSFGNLTIAQTGSINLIESNLFGVSPPVISTGPLAGATTSATYNYYNSVVATGGTLDAALFTGASDLSFTFGLTSTMTPPADGVAKVNFTSIFDSLTVALYYDYIDTPEPAALALFAIGAASLVMVRRRYRIT